MFNIETNVLKCKIKNKRDNFQSMPNIYKKMLLAWADMDITHNTATYQTILYEPIHDNPKSRNTHYTRLSKNNINYASNLGIFLWSKPIRVIWTSRRLVAEGNEMALFKKIC